MKNSGITNYQKPLEPIYVKIWFQSFGANVFGLTFQFIFRQKKELLEPGKCFPNHDANGNISSNETMCTFDPISLIVHVNQFPFSPFSVHALPKNLTFSRRIYMLLHFNVLPIFSACRYVIFFHPNIVTRGFFFENISALWCGENIFKIELAHLDPTQIDRPTLEFLDAKQNAMGSQVPSFM